MTSITVHVATAADCTAVTQTLVRPVPRGGQTLPIYDGGTEFEIGFAHFLIPTRGINQYRWHLMEAVLWAAAASATNYRHIIIPYVNAGSLSQYAYAHAPPPPRTRAALRMCTTRQTLIRIS
ncbi:hypothetical protein J6590_010188 [Homalodisca vitripennis]|nr:hypothetical protein J6590_010188 [Homalodisca vitripennis]